MKKLLIAPLLFFSFTAFAQVATKETVRGKAKEYFERADYDIAYRKYYAADSLLRLAVQEKDNFIDAWLMLGDLNAQVLRNNEKAISAYEKVVMLQRDYTSAAHFNLGLCYLNSGRYDKARSSMQTFLGFEKTAGENRLKAEKVLRDCDFAEQALKNPVPFDPLNMGKNINSADDESMPSLTADGKYLCFTRHMGTGMYADEDIYWSLLTASGYAPAISISQAINTEQYIEGAQNISASGKYLFFTSGDRPDGLGSTDIYMARKTGDQWERANNLGSPVNTPGYETQPYITTDGKALYFSAIRPEGEGGTDIYVSYLGENGTWSKPENLGRNINTMYDEMRPFLHADGRTLYFSSRGHDGMGNFDIYKTIRNNDGTWGKPENLGYPINTSGDELGIYVTADGGTAYYASEREGGFGQMDIYRFDMPAALRPAYTSYIKGTVYDAESRDAIYANVQIYDLETGKLYATLSTDKVNGVFLSTLPTGKRYAVQVMKDGYLFYSQHISLIEYKDQQPFEVNIALQKIKVGEKIVLNNIFFDTESYTLRDESKAELETVYKLLQKNPTLKIEIGGHTDNSGSEEKNLTLSENRAKSVYDYLVGKGVESFRLSYKGYASLKPVADNTTPEGKAKNRRTEIVVTGI